MTNSTCNFSITRIGYSNIIHENPYARVTLDKILLPGEEISGCTELPALKISIDPKELNIGHYDNFTFERNWLDDFWDFF